MYVQNSEDGISALVTHTAIYTILYSRESHGEREKQERREKRMGGIRELGVTKENTSEEQR